ncbi:mkrn2 opposite strand protein-like [Plakobranchus ocellatus]|uniref:Mkrn2 opposite strand protein-like n=1 Tax=Plakobranchus ocellatus TaxID=259542 RepID=A0AAV4B369_9GAST|nr:mkrn2 opposite strand protein-like [Plakobranchus ocellatus]
MDPKLRCFQHCRKDTNIVCFRLPVHCPLCHAETAETPCRIPPYVLPSPFVTSSAAPRSVVVRPTRGSFISHYDHACDLHIGLTNASGHVTEFDERGLNVGSIWPQCLAVLTWPLPQATQVDVHASPGPITRRTDDLSLDASRAWDTALEGLVSGVSGHLWTSSRYNEQTWNCFDLVFHILPLLGNDLDLDLSQLGPGERRVQFCDRYIVPKCRRVEEFVHLYRQVSNHGFVCVPRQQSSS